MRHHLRRALNVLALTTALAAAAPLAAPAAHADDPVTTGIDLANDTVAIGTDTATDLLAGCVPTVTSWTPIWNQPVANIAGTTGSTYYREVGGGTAHLNCSIPVKIIARVMDDAAPLSPAPFRIYTSPPSPTYVTSRDPSDTATVNVPYYGPDAPVLRPYGHITVQVQVYRKLSTGRYAQIRYGCMEWEYLIQPAAALGATDPRTEGACAYDPMFLTSDTIDSIGQQAAVAWDSPEAMIG